jgi:cell wall-associated NlpC family hydrolase
MRPSLRARRIAAVSASALLACGVFSPRPVLAATPEPTTDIVVNVFKQARLAAADLTRLQLEIAARLSDQAKTSSSASLSQPVLDEPDTPRFKIISSSTQLRRSAARLRSSAAQSPTHLKGVQIAAAVFPTLANVALSPTDAASALEVAATAHDQRALAQASAISRDHASRGIILPHAVLEADLVAPGATIPSAATRPLSLIQLLRVHELRFFGVSTVLDVAATELLSRAPEQAQTTPVQLVDAWALAGPRRTAAVLSALEQVGDRYLFGSRGPTAFDCSGLTHFSWLRQGVKVRTSSASQRAQLRSIERDDLRPGDFVFYGTRTTTDHVALSLGVSGLVVEANSRAGGVRVALFEKGLAVAFATPPLPEERTDSLLLP